MPKFRTLTCLLILTSAGSAFAKPEFWDLFQKHYQPSGGSAIDAGKCITCHVSQGNRHRNPYGLQIQELVDQSANQQLTVQMLQSIEAKDADGDSFSNIVEIKAGTLPGDPKSKPSATTQPHSDSPTSDPLIPLHSYHPLLVHFPIGIFLFGAFLDLFGAFRKKVEIRDAATYAIVIGALFQLVAVATGIIAMLRMGKTLEGTLLLHFISGISSCLLGSGVALWRRRDRPSTPTYWLLLVLAGLCLALSGHYGASMVWS